MQQETAARFGVLAQLPAAGARVGISRSVRDQVWPLNALRHAPEPGTSGWFIWAGGD
ncbi:immunity protein Imm33 domain-containing protein [Homoserinibacter gongjuensis]|uniref:immunity protein Imm33 domain-containing protein n=1 Tax=Homoserinibacter gongjuensis TaxID=1162968 RepID=UPI003D672426